MIWHDAKDAKPRQGKSVLLALKNGEVREGHWLKNANYRQKNVNRWRIYKTGKTVAEDEVIKWAEKPEVEL